RIVVASRRQGIDELLLALAQSLQQSPPEPAWRVPDAIAQEIAELKEALQSGHQLSERVAFAEAVSLLMQEGKAPTEHLSSSVRALIRTTQEPLAAHDIDFATQAIQAR